MKLLIAFMALIIMTSCSLNPYIPYPILQEDFATAYNKTSMLEGYIDNSGYWKSPRETETDHGGDCVDLSTYFVYHLGPQASMVTIRWSNIYHAIVKYDNAYYDSPSIGNETISIYNFINGKLEQYGTEFELIHTYDYDTVMYLSTDGWIK